MRKDKTAGIKPKLYGYVFALARDLFGDAACRAGHHEWTEVYGAGRYTACERCGAEEN